MDIEDLEEYALDGDKDAIKELIHIYETGDGVEKNEALAEHWRNELAEIEASESEGSSDSADSSEADHSDNAPESGNSADAQAQILSWRSEWESGDYSRKMIAALQGQTDNPYAQWSCGRQLRKASADTALSYYERAQSLLSPYIDQPEINKDFYSLLVETGDLDASLGKEEDAFRLYMQAHELSTAKTDPTSSLRLLDCYQNERGCTRDESRIERLEQELISTGSGNPEVLYRLMVEFYLSGDKLKAGLCAQYYLTSPELSQNPVWRSCAEIMLHFCQMPGDKGTVPSAEDVKAAENAGEGNAYVDTLKVLFADPASDTASLSEAEADEYWKTYSDDCNAALKEMNETGSQVIPANWAPLKKKAGDASAAFASRLEAKQRAEEQKRIALEKEEEEKRAAEERQRKDALKQKNAEERSKKLAKVRKGVIRLVVIVAIAAAAVFGIRAYLNRVISVDPFKYLSVSFEGIDGYGETDYTFDYDALAKDTVRDVESGSVTFSVSPQGSGLHNGDTVAVTVTPTKSLEDSRISFTGTESDYTVSGLPEGTAVDAFSDIDVSFNGRNGSGSVSIVNNSTDEFLKGVQYTAEPSSGLTTGDMVTVSATASSDLVLQYKEYPAETTKTYTVGDLERYATSITDISTDEFKNIVEEYQEIINSKLLSNWDTVFNVFSYNGLNNALYELHLDSYDGNISFDSAYLVSNKDSTQPIKSVNDSNDSSDQDQYMNRMILIYRVQTSQAFADKSDGNGLTRYLVVSTRNILINNGAVISKDTDDIRYANDFETSQSIYNQYVAQYEPYCNITSLTSAAIE